MTLNWGYLAGTGCSSLPWWYWSSRKLQRRDFILFYCWATIIASTTFGTTMADFADRSLGIGYAGGSALLFLCLLSVLALWYWSLGSLSVPNGEHAEGGSFLLGGHHVFPDAWYRAR